MKQSFTFVLFTITFLGGIAQSVDTELNHIISQMTTEEKIAQLTSNTFFTTADNTRLGIPGFQMSDGPHGVRFGGASVFPVGIAQAATWDPELIEQAGKAMGNEFWERGKHQQLGPCLDLCRDPRNGRSPETLGEDPFLAGKIATAVVKGIQTTPVLATAKHFNLVNKQQYRYNSNIIVSDRWLIEHYGHDFRMVIQEGGVLSIMNAYNLINGTHCSQNNYLLQTILRDKWEFPFYVVSDWGAVHDSKYAIEAGTDICMGSSHYADQLPGLLSSGNLDMEILDRSVYRVLFTKLVNGMLDNYPRCTTNYINSQTHNELVLEVGRKSLTLLKNQDNILPLDPNTIDKIALIGPSANIAQLDGFGSSWVDPIYTVSPREGIENIVGSQKVTYVQGCDINSADTSGFAAAMNAASDADVVIFIGGLDDTQEGEGYGNRPEYDRAGGSVDLPGKQQQLINRLASVNENVIVVLKSGGICGVNDCITNIKGFIYAFYPGHEGGNAIAEAIFGLYNPGGKLPVTMPKADSQLPPWNDNFNDDYGCGYRWYDENDIIPEFTFGFGLSYTSFTYSNILLSAAQIEKGKQLQVSVEITNTGQYAGDEVAQLYLSNISSGFWMPEKQLKGFERIHLLPGESKTVTFTLTTEEFYFWNENQYQVEPGTYQVSVGGSSDDLPLLDSFKILEAVNMPDLTIANVYTLPRYPQMGDSVRFIATIKNSGTESIDPGDNFDLYFHVDNQEVAAVNLSTKYISTGGMIMIEAEGQYWIPADSGKYEITAVVDKSNQLAETVENNNLYTDSLQVYDSLDLRFMQNIALFKPVTATSFESNDYKPEFAVDGNYSTRWSSEFNDPQEFIINLQNHYDISSIRIIWETAYSNAYEVSVSNNSEDWTSVISENDGDGGIDHFNLSNEAKYIKFTGLERATEWGHSFYEFEVFGNLKHSNWVNEPGADPGISIYPNPAREKIFLSGIDANSKVYFSIYDVNGKEKINQLFNPVSPIDISRLIPGIYFLRISGDDIHKTATFIKTR